MRLLKLRAAADAKCQYDAAAAAVAAAAAAASPSFFTISAEPPSLPDSVVLLYWLRCETGDTCAPGQRVGRPGIPIAPARMAVVADDVARGAVGMRRRRTGPTSERSASAAAAASAVSVDCLYVADRHRPANAWPR